MAICLFCLGPAAANSLLDRAINEYNAGNYTEAIGLFGQAEPTDFNNPVLHYYLANALSKTNQTKDAIKEYKIALALEPDGQMAEYCQRALRVLRGIRPAISTGSNPRGLPGNPMLPPIGEPPVVKLKPRVIAVLCGCPLCHRIEAILHGLETQYGDRIAFTRVMQNAADPEMRQIIQDYDADKCPTVLFFDTTGHLAKERDGQVAEADLRHDTEALATAAGPSQFNNPADEHFARLRDNIVREAEARCSDDQRRVDEEIRMIQYEENMQIQDLSHRSFYHGDAIHQIREDSQNKIDALKKDLERKKAEILAAAAAKIEALSSTTGGRQSIGDLHPPAQNNTSGGNLPPQH